MKYLINSTGINLFHKSRAIKIEDSSPLYAKVLEILELPVAEQEAAFERALAAVEPNRNIAEKGFVVSGEQVTYQGQVLPSPLAKKIRSLIDQKIPVTIFEKFWENLRQNPSFHVVNETGFYDFLDYKELPITEDGCFVAYRGVQKDFYSKSGDTQTVVLKGTVDQHGRIYNGIGEEIEVVRNGVCDDRNVHCAAGSLHVGSLDYARGWANGGQLIAVKVNPRDVVSVPNDCKCQKCRVCRYEVIDVVEQEIIHAAVDVFLQPSKATDAFEKESEKLDYVRQRISDYLARKRVAGVRSVSLKAVQGIFSPDCPSKIQILDALRYLGYRWEDQTVYV